MKSHLDRGPLYVADQDGAENISLRVEQIGIRWVMLTLGDQQQDIASKAISWNSETANVTYHQQSRSIELHVWERVKQ